MKLLLSHGARTLRVDGARISALPAQAGDLHIELRGDRLLPGLINAHDHLQLNALPRLKYRAAPYANVSQWIADIDPRMQVDPLLRANAAVPRAQRLFIGGIKNLLSGVTTVAHHDPQDGSLASEHFPVRVVTRMGWSHSLALDGARAVQAAQRSTPADAPWIIHAAEGVDETAAAEFDELDALGCLAPNTVLVHGVALSAVQQQRLAQAGAGLVWCPGSNLHLFGGTPDVRGLIEQGRVALGNDSRISGERDLLDELGVAAACVGLDEAGLAALVGARAAALLRLNDRGSLAPGQLADLLVLPADARLGQLRRADVRLVLVGGLPRLADPDYAEVFGATVDLLPVRVDGRRKFMARELVQALAASPIQEPGLMLETH